MVESNAARNRGNAASLVGRAFQLGIAFPILAQSTGLPSALSIKYIGLR